MPALVDIFGDDACLQFGGGTLGREMLAALGSQKDLSTVVVVMAGADEAATLQFLAPYTGATVAEYFMIRGEAT